MSTEVHHFVRCISLPRATGAACGHHVSGITTGNFAGFYDFDWTTWKISEVLDALRRGERFLILLPDGGLTSELAPFLCPECGKESIRSMRGGAPTGDLDAMPVM